MTIWVDADSVPRDIRPLLARRSTAYIVRFVAARALPDIPPTLLTIVASGADAADHRIEENATLGDLVVTRDIPFAERLAERGILVINDRGELFSKENIAERRSLRDAAAELRLLGVAPESRKGSSRGARETKFFADGLEKALARMRKSSS